MRSQNKCRNPQETAAFYLSETRKGSGRYWWMTMNKERLRELILEFLQSKQVNDDTKLKLAMIPI